jgi:hypothetical protein
MCSNRREGRATCQMCVRICSCCAGLQAIGCHSCVAPIHSCCWRCGGANLACVYISRRLVVLLVRVHWECTCVSFADGATSRLLHMARCVGLLLCSKMREVPVPCFYSAMHPDKASFRCTSPPLQALLTITHNLLHSNMRHQTCTPPHKWRHAVDNFVAVQMAPSVNS